MSVLRKIIEAKKSEIPKSSDLAGRECLQNTRDFLRAISLYVPDEKKEEERSSRITKKLIAELKKNSPSKGSLRQQVEISAVVSWYRPYAAAMSVLTEKNYFSGSLDDLATVYEQIEIPLLRKDFLTQTIQVKEARIYGASAYLLIVAALEKNQLDELILAGSEYKMHALVEVHNEQELEMALQTQAKIIGINNRNLNTLEIDLATTPRLLSLLNAEQRQDLVLVAESGYYQRNDLQALPDEVDAVLIGSAFMEAEDPQKKIQEMFG